MSCLRRVPAAGIAAAAVTLLTNTMVRAATYPVGPTRESRSLNTVLSKLQPGDVVEIDPGVYRETVRLTMNGTPKAPITIRGVGETRPVFEGDGQDTSGKGSVPRGVFQIEGANIVLEHLEIRNARNGENAAGVRLLRSTNATIRDCRIHHCDMGIFGDDRETARIENCDVSFNGSPTFDGYSHNLYMGGNRVVVKGCYIHDSLHGQNYKSRAHYNELWFNYITDSNEGEVGCVDSKGETDRPNSHTLLVENTIRSRPDRKGNTAKFVLFGSESGNSHNGTLYLFRNTFLAGDSRIVFVTLSDPKAGAVLSGNMFAGSTQILTQAKPAASVAAGRNQLPVGASLPGAMSASSADFRYIDGDGMAHILTEDSYRKQKPSDLPDASRTGRQR